MPDDLAQGFALTMPGTPAVLQDVRLALRAWLSVEHVPSLVQIDVVLAVDEAVANAVEHAIPRTPGTPVEFSVVAFVRSHEFLVTVSDNGGWRESPRNAMRGRGIPLMIAVMTTVDIERSESGTTVHMSRTF
ncbi:ATP-binding protein [Smaragdicoccus niigatensis]|uniref:ATP-binding protein n=1 Tax=Smaragdicoccus niigatensis TaxID=359359 RepID=UPI00138ABD59|nr:ATP-binding protein [Smaragdicoccus niigatensis]